MNKETQYENQVKSSRESGFASQEDILKAEECQDCNFRCIQGCC